MLSGELPWLRDSGQGAIISYKFTGRLNPLSGELSHLNDSVMGMLRSSSSDRFESCSEFLSLFRSSSAEDAKRKAEEEPTPEIADPSPQKTGRDTQRRLDW